jgi:hypothetical protein
MKFTFKTDKPKGSYSSFFPNHNRIKLNKKDVGTIDDKKPFKIRLMVEKDDIMEDGNPNCKWRWVTLKQESDSLQDAKDFINRFLPEILIKYTIHTKE